MPSKHEVLDFMSRHEYVTHEDLIEEYNCKLNTIIHMMRRLRLRNEVRLVEKVAIHGARKCSRFNVYEITKRGLGKLRWYDENTCPYDYCSCKNH